VRVIRNFPPNPKKEIIRHKLLVPNSQGSFVQFATACVLLKYQAVSLVLLGGTLLSLKMFICSQIS